MGWSSSWESDLARWIQVFSKRPKQVPWVARSSSKKGPPNFSNHSFSVLQLRSGQWSQLLRSTWRGDRGGSSLEGAGKGVVVA
jgi:hypothetical protein